MAKIKENQNSPERFLRRHRRWFPFVGAILLLGTFLVNDALRNESTGIPLEQVSMLLGHKSVKITEKHYAPWVKARQEQLAANVRKAWATLDAGNTTTRGKSPKSVRSA